MTDDEGPRPRYQWIKDRDEDRLFAGWVGKRKFGRLLNPSNNPSKWDWNLVCLAGVRDFGRLGNAWYGSEDTARLAAKACEDAYDAAMAGTLFGMTPEDVEAIHEHERFMKARRG
ncbi:hypothetical protein IB238_09030 [Rhizobium sp. ARZ01]|uniref:hypothetical protein n=1 Tax=Rhizobium sp. ARZ01 TaxID=2769313 RepID=UPI001784AF8E|nr:hypothetical protein [Rhizobium sp. ARZ01]MBD9372763.1 hypothetical protein [Rhizobium sp. ARZ01]